MATDDADDDGGGRRTKVERLADEYDLESIGDVLERRWTAADDRLSLRQLAALFNRRLLESALSAAGVSTVDGEVENYYRLLTDDEVGSGERTRIRRRLSREGVDVDALRSDFVSYQSVRRYLTDHRNVSYEASEGGESAGDLTTIRRLKRRLSTVVESRLGRHGDAGSTSIEKPSVVVDVRVMCEECGDAFVVDEVLTGADCACS